MIFSSQNRIYAVFFLAFDVIFLIWGRICNVFLLLITFGGLEALCGEMTLPIKYIFQILTVKIVLLDSFWLRLFVFPNSCSRDTLTSIAILLVDSNEIITNLRKGCTPPIQYTINNLRTRSSQYCSYLGPIATELIRNTSENLDVSWNHGMPTIKGTYTNRSPFSRQLLRF